MARSDKRRSKLKGRTNGGFIILPHSVLRSREFGRLSPKAVKLLIELAGLYNGQNNGDLSCAFSQLKERGWRSAGTLALAIRELLDTQFSIVTRHGGKHRCSLYAITWWPVNECKGKLEVRAESVASNAWKNSLGSQISEQSAHISDQSQSGEPSR